MLKYYMYKKKHFTHTFAVVVCGKYMLLIPCGFNLLLWLWHHRTDAPFACLLAMPAYIDIDRHIVRTHILITNSQVHWKAHHTTVLSAHKQSFNCGHCAHVYGLLMAYTMYLLLTYLNTRVAILATLENIDPLCKKKTMNLDIYICFCKCN